jgi:hypothetical protein
VKEEKSKKKATAFCLSVRRRTSPLLPSPVSSSLSCHSFLSLVRSENKKFRSDLDGGVSRIHVSTHEHDDVTTTLV